jgi:hypothetical protein
MIKVDKLVQKLLIISLVILGSAILGGCKSKAVITLSPEELAIALTKSAYQQGTREAIFMMTNEREADSSATPTPAGMEGGKSETQSMSNDPGVPTDTPSIGMPTLSPTATATFQSSTVVPGLTMTPTATNALTPTWTKTATATGVKTATPQTGWGGIWVGYLQQADGTYISGPLIVTLSGDQVSGVFYASGVDMTLTGTLSTDGQQANGRYTYQPGEGWFLWLRETNLQFRGCIDNQFAFCAAREGVSQPDPCGYYSPY